MIRVRVFGYPTVGSRWYADTDMDNVGPLFDIVIEIVAAFL
jgi:hypothetical protein